MRSPMRTLTAAGLVLVLGAAACNDDALNPPDQTLADPLFARYAAIGNSITAGYQSGGINDSTQLRSYAVVLAEAMGTTFYSPLMNKPGCPPPLTNVFTQTRVPPPVPGGCALRQSQAVPPPYINNVAVPGASVIDAFSNFDPTASPNPLTTFFLGGQTQTEMLERVRPTFVTVWIGTNDVLGAALDAANPGDPALVTSPPTFGAQFEALMDTLDALGTVEGGVAIGAIQVGFAPYFTQGRAWKQAELQFDALTAPINFFDVTNACLTFTTLSATDTAWTSVPFAKGAPVFGLANARKDSVLAGTLAPQNVVTAVLDCTDAMAITSTELANITGAVVAYNQIIETAATARGWAFIDPNDLLAALLPTPACMANSTCALRPFPAFDPADPQHVTAPFGSALSLDGIHPSTGAHQIVASALAQAINAAYGTTIPAIP